jgi:hypothetical protein
MKRAKAIQDDGTQNTSGEALNHNDAEIETPAASRADVQTALRRNPINEELQEAKIVLFPYRKRNPEEGKTYPVMRGTIEWDEAAVQIAGFKKPLLGDGGEVIGDYLSLSIGNVGGEKLYGALFHSSKEGKENTFTGNIEKSVKTGAVDEEGKEIFERVWVKAIRASVRTYNEGGKARQFIRGKVTAVSLPDINGDDEDGDIPF